MTQGTDITEAFETHHINMAKVLPVLSKYRVGPAEEPRNIKLTFEENGFYKTLKRRVVKRMEEVEPQKRQWLSDVCCFRINLNRHFQYSFGLTADPRHPAGRQHCGRRHLHLLSVVRSALRIADDVAGDWRPQLSAHGGQLSHVLLQHRIPQLPRVARIARPVSPPVHQFSRRHGDDGYGAAHQLVAHAGRQVLVEPVRRLGVRVVPVSDNVLP